jgi:hypothetical protein
MYISGSSFVLSITITCHLSAKMSVFSLCALLVVASQVFAVPSLRRDTASSSSEIGLLSNRMLSHIISRGSNADEV